MIEIKAKESQSIFHTGLFFINNTVEIGKKNVLKKAIMGRNP